MRCVPASYNVHALHCACVQVRVDQEQLETVLPRPGGEVRVVNGPHRGTRGELIEINEKKFKAVVSSSKDDAARIVPHTLQCLTC